MIEINERRIYANFRRELRVYNMYFLNRLLSYYNARNFQLIEIRFSSLLFRLSR